MRGMIAVVVALTIAGAGYCGEPGELSPRLQQAFGQEPISAAVERPESVSLQTPGAWTYETAENVLPVEAPAKATWGGLFKALVGFPFRLTAAVLRETGDTSATVVETGADYAGSIGGEMATLEE